MLRGILTVGGYMGELPPFHEEKLGLIEEKFLVPYKRNGGSQKIRGMGFLGEMVGDEPILVKSPPIPFQVMNSN